MQVWSLARHSGLKDLVLPRVWHSSKLAWILSLAQELHMPWGDPPPKKKKERKKKRPLEENSKFDLTLMFPSLHFLLSWILCLLPPWLSGRTNSIVLPLTCLLPAKFSHSWLPSHSALGFLIFDLGLDSLHLPCPSYLISFVVLVVFAPASYLPFSKAGLIHSSTALFLEYFRSFCCSQIWSIWYPCSSNPYCILSD